MISPQGPNICKRQRLPSHLFDVGAFYSFLAAHAAPYVGESRWRAQRCRSNPRFSRTSGRSNGTMVQEVSFTVAGTAEILAGCRAASSSCVLIVKELLRRRMADEARPFGGGGR